MTRKITVGLHRKIGQPNYGSLGASCEIEVVLEDPEFNNADLLATRIEQAYGTCRQSIARELATAPHERSTEVTEPLGPSGDHAVPARSATEAQVRAIRAIASKAGVQLASELTRRFGVRSPVQLSIRQASQLIDELKSQLEGTPA
jgi:hypothetical protein